MSHGPVQYFVFSFPGHEFKDEFISALAKATSAGVIQIVDIVFINKGSDGEMEVLEINDLDDELFNSFSEIVERAEGILSDDDVQKLSADIPTDSFSALLVFEHVWAVDVTEAIRNAKGVVVTQGFVPREIVETVLNSRI